MVLRLVVVIVFFALSIINLSAQLKNRTTQADYIIITPSEFVTTLQPFIEWRESQNMEVEVVELEEIYSEFPDSTKASSIRNFVSYSLRYWSDPKPKYLLLVGDVEHLPSYRVASRFANSHYEDSVSIDEWYSINLYDLDTIPDIALGRFPVRNEEELYNVIEKTVNYEASLKDLKYSIKFLFLTDIKDSTAFENATNKFIDEQLPYNYSYKVIYPSQDQSIEESKERLITGLNNGTVFFSYYGHGAPYLWSEYNLFDFEDVDLLENNNYPFIYTAAACSQSFDLPNDSSITRNLIIGKNKGTIASIASTGLNYLSLGANYLTSFYSYVFKNPEMTIGEAVLYAKIDLINDESEDAILRRYTLLGDPALRNPVGIITQIFEPMDEIPTTFTLEQNYPNPFNPTTTIEYSIPYSSHVKLSVYNILGQRVTNLIDGIKQPGNYKVEFDGSNISSGIYFYRIQAGDFVETKKLILLK